VPIIVACPGCPTRLSAPESAAGKQIRCPKCGAIATVPAPASAADVPVVDAAVVSPAPQTKRVLADEGDRTARPRTSSSRDNDDERPRKRKRPRYADDDDDYEHDHPRRRRRQSGGGGGVVAAVVGGLVLVAVAGAGVYLLAGKGSLFAKKAPVPPGWQQYSYPQDGFRAYFPAEPAHSRVPINGFQLGGAGGFGGPFGAGGFQQRDGLQDAETVSVLSSGVANGSVQIQVLLIRYRNSIPAGVRDQVRRGVDAQPAGAFKSVRWLGYDALEQTDSLSASRMVLTDRSIIVVRIAGRNARTTPAEEAAFFDHFELTR